MFIFNNPLHFLNTDYAGLVCQYRQPPGWGYLRSMDSCIVDSCTMDNNIINSCYVDSNMVDSFMVDSCMVDKCTVDS